MSPGPTFDRVYLALKEQLTSGSFAPGDHLEPAAIGDDLHSSITPVRDALHRLVGECLVEAPRNDGFRVPLLTEAELRNLYGWNRELLELALRRSSLKPIIPTTDLQDQDSYPARTAALFRQIAAQSVNPELVAAVLNMNDRLASMRIVEARLFSDYEEELSGSGALFAAGDFSGLRRAIAAYHKRRQRKTPDLLVAARQTREPR